MSGPLDLQVPAVASAVRFYCQVFGLGAGDVSTDGPTVLLRVDEHLRLRVRPDGPPERSYDRGRTPRLELRVDDVDARLSRWVAAGMTVLCRLADGPAGVLHPARRADEVCVYAQLVDPYGHLWALCREPSVG